MGSQVPANCCVEEFALGSGRLPFFCLGKAGFKELQTMEVQILANGGQSERINQLWLWMAKAQITDREAWHFRPFLSPVESSEHCLSKFVSRSREIL